MRKGKVLLGTLGALAIGAVAGILLAPEKGSKTRKQIMDKADDYVGELKSKYDELHHLLTKKFESSKKDAERLFDKGKANYYDANKDVENAASNFKKDSAADFNIPKS